MDFPAMLGEKPVGKVQVLREGLYWRVICRCQLTGQVIFRLAAVTAEKREYIGVVVPMGKGFGLDRRISARSFDPEDAEFQLSPKVEEGPFLPISPEEPFHYIEKLKNAYLARKDGQTGIVIREEIKPQAGG